MKLIEVTKPPIDGIEFIAIWEDESFIMNNKYKIVNGTVFKFDSGDYRFYKRHDDLLDWEIDINAKFFVVGLNND